MNLCASERRGIGGYLRVFSSNRTKSSTMSHCLHIDEILRKVVLEIYAYGGLRTLRNLAITCTAFREPALDELWHRQSSLAPLIQCLPGHLWAVVPRVIDDWTNESTTVKILNSYNALHRRIGRQPSRIFGASRSLTRQALATC
ncbi:hypothetical protein PLICRDRAFT_651552 [Plicaturopsis crispa FD-325 SS-3]|nr:hypothetical protein PLICRDRAFT_651552 [Plicaturopsis crispa FD-325 SS-3]